MSKSNRVVASCSRRHVWFVLMLLSAILFTCVAGLWLRSNTRSDSVKFRLAYPQYIDIKTYPGVVFVGLNWMGQSRQDEYDAEFDSFFQYTSTKPLLFSAKWLVPRNRVADSIRYFAGFGYGWSLIYGAADDTESEYVVIFPMWFFMLLDAALFTWLLRKWLWWLAHYKRVCSGLCPDCGDDLRASAGACPECGGERSVVPYDRPGGVAREAGGEDGVGGGRLEA